MMQLSPSFLGKVASLEPRDAWRLIVDEALSICREPIDLPRGFENGNPKGAASGSDRYAALLDRLGALGCLSRFRPEQQRVIGILVENDGGSEGATHSRRSLIARASLVASGSPEARLFGEKHNEHGRGDSRGDALFRQSPRLFKSRQPCQQRRRNTPFLPSGQNLMRGHALEGRRGRH